ncbi:hypothetical protein GCM10009753_72920 [Streptantibioticus ferralitis]
MSFRVIAETIGRHLDLPVLSVPPQQAGAHFGWLGAAAVLDNPSSSTVTRDSLGWRPVRPGLIADLDEDHYFCG